jgi:hypothetical protein
MSTFGVAKEVKAGPSAPSLDVVPAKLTETDEGIFDRHPLVPIFIAGITALALCSAMIQSILLWLSLLHS